MKVVFTLFMLGFISSFTCEVYDPATSNLEEFSDAAMLVVDEVNIQDAFQAAKNFLDVNKDRTDFVVTAAESIITKLTAVASDASVSKANRSQAWLYISGIHGRISDKLRANGGTAHGKKALSSLKQAISLDGNNKNAGNAYGTTIHRMIKKNMITRKFIEGGMGIDLGDEAKAAVKVLESMGLTNHAGYKDLKDF